MFAGFMCTLSYSLNVSIVLHELSANRPRLESEGFTELNGNRIYRLDSLALWTQHCCGTLTKVICNALSPVLPNRRRIPLSTQGDHNPAYLR